MKETSGGSNSYMRTKKNGQSFVTPTDEDNDDSHFENTFFFTHKTGKQWGVSWVVAHRVPRIMQLSH